MSLNCSDETAAQIDAEVVAIIKESYEKALEMLRENRDVMDKLAAFLIEKETITGKEFMKIFREAKGLPEPEEEKKEDKSAEKNKEAEKEAEPQEEAERKEDAEPVSEGVEETTVFEEVLREATADSQCDDAKEDDAPRGLFSNGRVD